MSDLTATGCGCGTSNNSATMPDASFLSSDLFLVAAETKAAAFPLALTTVVDAKALS